MSDLHGTIYLDGEEEIAVCQDGGSVFLWPYSVRAGNVRIALTEEQMDRLMFTVKQLQKENTRWTP